MKIQCDYCNNTYEDTLPQCPHCGGENPSHKNEGQPKTIEELQSWYRARNLPPEDVTRFFIGKDIKEAKAFGIYRDEDSGEFVVYKNKADGSRAVRYRGKDEQYAVNEIYQKLKDEIVKQKARLANTGVSRGTGTGSGNSAGRSQGNVMRYVIIAVTVFIFLSYFISALKPSKNGYYSYNGSNYYRYDNNWYYYDTLLGDWYDTSVYDYTVPAPLESADQNSEYYDGSNWQGWYGTTDWNDTEYYDQTHSSSSFDSDYDWSSDSSWDWDSGSDWDSGGSDWDSDW